MNVMEILDEIDEMLEKSKAFPLAAHKIMIDGDRLRELVNDVRLNLPKELKRAQLIDYDCDRIMKEAQQNAEKVVRDAEDRAKKLASESEIVEEAKRKAHELLTKTKAKCDETKEATAAYVERSLATTEKQIAAALEEIKKERENWVKPE
ncbi:MAG: vacuolar-type H+-ATPase subunit H [Oscillospiraceae bacterium]|nr:vacuolar-type H+-ATPase subunit H [Oscillospiraceae bacterium]